MNSVCSIVAGVGLILATAQSGRSSVIFQRALPVANLNTAAGSNRANIEWGENVKNPQRLIGDTFTLPATASGAWKINSITVYSVGSGGQLGDEFSGVTLYLGRNGNPLTVAMAGTLNAGGSANNNANITHTPINYSNGQIYEGTPGTF